ncbi:MAG: NUDIX hydrolase [bacterium]
MPDQFEVSVKAIVFNKNKDILWCLEKEGIWDLPGGRISHGEKPEECLNRECKEEMGVGCRIINKRPIYAFFGINPQDANTLNLCYEAELVGDSFIKTGEHVSHEYLNLEKLKDVDLNCTRIPLIEILEKEQSKKI